jgi:hypothetical protein
MMKKSNKILLGLAGCAMVAAGVAGVLANGGSLSETHAEGTVSVHRLYVINNAWSEKNQCGIYIYGSSMTSYNSSSWDASSNMNWIDGTVNYGLFYYDIPMTPPLSFAKRLVRPVMLIKALTLLLPLLDTVIYGLPRFCE